LTPELTNSLDSKGGGRRSRGIRWAIIWLLGRVVTYSCREPVDDREFEECNLIFLKMAGILNFIATFVRAEIIYVAQFLTTYTHRCGHAHIALVRRERGTQRDTFCGSKHMIQWRW